ncbi:MAG: galactokinase [Desulfobacteraceae bacterium]|nr:galactokinase [Desulfobacteraceae bacterium]MBC2757746.1 galactokinase [Desulfobacteraceae bacterium]
MNSKINEILKSDLIEASAPCRIDMGGTLDISSFYYPLSYLNSCTFNIALAMRTRVKIVPFQKGYIKISSKGFESAEYPVEKMPFDHPMGLMFAIAAYFQIDGIHIIIESGSPPRSALGGSSVAAVALIAAFNILLEKSGRPMVAHEQIPLLAHGIEESVAGVPCGFQDQLAAVYGGVNAWYWKGAGAPQPFIRRLIVHPERYEALSNHLLLAYCGIPHESRNINSRWVKQFISGECRTQWVEIVNCTLSFADAFVSFNIEEAVKQLNRETAIRVEMTPDVLDDTGSQLVHSALDHNCGARFTGAGGGGCIWALGPDDKISELKIAWDKILSERKEACLLDINIDKNGVLTGPV